MSPVDYLFAPAKLTRALRVVGVREDGYHLLEAEMVSVDLQDELEVDSDAEGFEVVDQVAWTRGESGPTDPLSVAELGGPGHFAVPKGTDNLVVRALEATGRTAGVRLRKRIPAGAGLGGGSSDAAAVLRWARCVDPKVAVKMGADVPFCVVGGRAQVSGIGEVLEPLDFEAFTAVLVTPGLSVSTPDVYRAWDALGGPEGAHGNDLEPAALAVEPRLVWWRDLIMTVSGERPRLAGSGGTWYVQREQEMAQELVAQLTKAVMAAGARALVVAVSSIPHC
jgi:4-diphosphocytidyl-2-C-methyl-D-erythritol kinase